MRNSSKEQQRQIQVLRNKLAKFEAKLRKLNSIELTNAELLEPNFMFGEPSKKWLLELNKSVLVDQIEATETILKERYGVKP